MKESKPHDLLGALRESVRRHLTYSRVVQVDRATPDDRLSGLSLAVRERIADVMLATQARQESRGVKRLAYLSMEFLMGRSLENNLMNPGLLEAGREAIATSDADFEELCGCEHDAALGNGGLGRLAVCFLDSLATLDLPGYGYGINYEFGLLQQYFVRGEQRERADAWAAMSSPWLIERPNDVVLVPVYGRVVHEQDKVGGYSPMWMDWQVIVGVPHDMPIVGYGGCTVNALRLFSARAANEFNVDTFNSGDYVRALEDKIDVEKISKVLYPSDAIAAGKELRLLQEYFLVACAVRDLLRTLSRRKLPLDTLPDHLASQLNDTDPALTVAELMRLLVDEEGFEWDKAWSITNRTLGYTNHTLLPEALEKWSVALMERVVPRHMQIIYEINHRFLRQVAAPFPGDGERVRRMSLIEESGDRYVRMANLSIVGSHSSNGVAALHSELVKTKLVPDFHALFPERFNNKTNGVTPRRWLRLANPGLSTRLDQSIGPGWTSDLDQLQKLEAFADDAAFREKLERVKRENRERLAAIVTATTREIISPRSLFDVQVKRIHEYKRKLLNILHVVHRYLTIVEDGVTKFPPRPVIFAGKAAPGYAMAKQIIRLIHDVGRVVNQGRRARELLRVVFIPDHRVSLAEKIIPAADLSEQISTAGMEASGTGNMKLSMNGALTIGTMDGANVEICEEVGRENFFLFGLETHEVERLRVEHRYRPFSTYRADVGVRRVIDAIADGLFSEGDAGRHGRILHSLLHGGDEQLVLADFRSYVDAQGGVARAFADRVGWGRKTVLSIAKMGKFSSDRTIHQYAEEIWDIRQVR